MFIYALILALALGTVFKGNLKNLATCDISSIYLIFIGFSIEAILHFLTIYGILHVGIVTYLFNLLMYILIFIFIYFNRKNKFILIMGFGFILNAIVIFLNGGVMPVAHSAIVNASLPSNVGSEGLYGLAGSGTRLWLLGDVLTCRILGHIAFSIGDLISAIGLMLFVITAMRGKVKKTLKV